MWRFYNFIMKKLFVLFLLLGLFVQQFVFAQTSKADKKAERWVENMLRSLSLREKIGQMVMVRMSGEFTNLNSEKFAESRRQVEENRLGGFMPPSHKSAAGSIVRRAFGGEN